MVACSVENKIEMDKTRIWVSGVGLKGQFPEPDARHDGLSLQCTATSRTVSRLPVGAYSKRSDGPVLYTLRPRCTRLAATA